MHNVSLVNTYIYYYYTYVCKIHIKYIILNLIDTVVFFIHYGITIWHDCKNIFIVLYENNFIVFQQKILPKVHLKTEFINSLKY